MKHNDLPNAHKYLKSYWIDSTDTTNYPSLQDDINVDVAIIGGGIVGITAGYLLKNKGVNFAILEASQIVQGTSAFTTAKVTSQHNLIYETIKNSSGIEHAKQYADANQSSIGFIEDTINLHKIECDFERLPAYVYTNDDSYIKKIENEAEIASSLGIKAKVTNSLPINIPIKNALVFENQAQFHPRKYLLALANYLSSGSNCVFENTSVLDIEKGNSIVITTREGKKVTASKVIISSHFPCYDGLGLYLARLRPERSYIIAANIKEAFPNSMFISAEKPTRSLRYQNNKGKQLILIGGDGHKVAHGENFSTHYSNLQKFAQDIFKVEDFLYNWSAQDYITLDKIPYVGNLSLSDKNIYVATGFGKWGMTNGTAAARILVDKILSKNNPWEEVYNPSRSLTLRAYKNIVTENFDVAKELVMGKLKSGETKVTLKIGEGKVVDIDGNKYGAYKDENEVLHLVDVTCTHLGCELKWNDAEKSWDCPCHGSRFSYDGEILEGPATHKLNHYKEGTNKIHPNFV